MLITVTIRGDELHLAAYSHSEEELRAVDAVLAKVGLSGSHVASKRLLDPRPGRLYRIRVDEAYKLEELLQVRFSGAGRKTRIAVDGSDGVGDDGSGYRCERVVRNGMGKGCIDIDAHNMDVAIVKCALLARKKKWFGAVARKGPCPSRPMR
jgi:hypothetical protein